MSPSMDQPRPVRNGRHRAEPAAPSTAPPVVPVDTAPTRGAHAKPIAPATPKQVGPNAPATPKPVEPLETAPISIAPAARTKPAPSSTPQAAPAVRASRTHRVGPFGTEPQAVLKKAASVRVMSHRMAVVAGAVAVLLGVGSAGQATELAFFGKESPAQDAAASGDATAEAPVTSNSAATPTSGLPTGSADATKPSGTPALPDPAAPGIGNVPATPNPGLTSPLNVKFPAPTIAATAPGVALAASPAASPSAYAAPSATGTPSATASPTVASPATSTPTTSPSPATASTATATAVDDAVQAQAYASSRLASYGWGADQMQSLIMLWDTGSDWKPAKVDSGLNYIKERYGSPADALEFRKEHKSY